MARARSIKPGFFKNEELCELPPVARLLFAGLWTLADREGRLEDRPKRIVIEIFPYENVKSIEKHLESLTVKGFIQRYVVDGQKYIAIVKWHKHQNPHHMEVPSEIPPPPGEENRYNHTPVTKQMKLQVFGRDGYKCVLCQSDKKLSIDHIIPVSKGGTSAMDNLRTLCERCNLKRGNRVDDSFTDRGQVVKIGSYPTDSLNPVTLTLNPVPDSVVPERPAGRDDDGDGDAKIAEAIGAYVNRPNAAFVQKLAGKCFVADPECTWRMICLAVHAVVRDEGEPPRTPGYFDTAVPELIEDPKDWPFLKRFVVEGPTQINVSDAKSYCRDRSVPERIRRFLNAWLASVQSEGAAA